MFICTANKNYIMMNINYVFCCIMAKSFKLTSRVIKQKYVNIHLLAKCTYEGKYFHLSCFLYDEILFRLKKEVRSDCSIINF